MSNNTGVFGYQFQSDSAVYLFIDAFKNCNTIRVEGKFEDIELLLRDGKQIYCQAKATYDSLHDISKFKDSVRTLSKVYNKKDIFIYATNQLAPISSLKNSFDQHEIVYMKYSELQEVEKEIIKKYYLDKGIEIDENFFILRIPYESNKDMNTKRSFMIDKLRDLLRDINEPVRNASSIFALWSSYLYDHSSRDYTLNVPFKDMLMLYHGFYVLNSCTTNSKADLVDKYFHDLIIEKINKYEIINKIVETYHDIGISHYIENNLKMLGQLIFSKDYDLAEEEIVSIEIIVDSVLSYSERFNKFEEMFKQ